MIWVIAISRLVRSPIPDSSSHYIGPQKWTALLIDAQSQLISSFITAISFGWNTNTRQPCSPFGRLFKYKHGPRRTQSSTKASLWLVLFFFQKKIFCRIKSDRPRSSIQLARTAGRKVHARTNFLFFFPLGHQIENAWPIVSRMKYSAKMERFFRLHSDELRLFWAPISNSREKISSDFFKLNTRNSDEHEKEEVQDKRWFIRSRRAVASSLVVSVQRRQGTPTHRQLSEYSLMTVFGSRLNLARFPSLFHRPKPTRNWNTRQTNQKGRRVQEMNSWPVDHRLKPARSRTWTRAQIDFLASHLLCQPVFRHSTGATIRANSAGKKIIQKLKLLIFPFS